LTLENKFIKGKKKPVLWPTQWVEQRHE